MYGIRRRASFFELPEELILKIFENLSVADSQSLISSLVRILGEHSLLSAESNNVEQLILLLYRRLYEGKLYVGERQSDENPYAHSLSVEQFQKILKDGSEDMRERWVLEHSKLQVMVFRVVRDTNDYVRFVTELQRLNLIFKELVESDNTNKYLRNTHQIELIIDGKTMSMEPPTSIVNAVLSMLISLSGKCMSSGNFVGSKLTKLSIVSTDIGDHYFTRWCQLLGRFNGLTDLDLTDNLLRLDQFDAVGSLKVDILGKLFIFPSRLKVLILDNNLLSYISTAFLQNLPKETLEILLLRNNNFVTFGQESSSDFSLIEYLPNLVRLDLSYNSLLRFIDSRVFENISKNGKFKKLSISYCNLDEMNLRALRTVPVKEKFKLEQ